MSKPKFSRDGSGGYNAEYTTGGATYAASLQKTEDGNQWYIAEGFGSGSAEYDKLRDLKAVWADLCEQEGAPTPPPKLSGPPKLSAPPKLSGPPKLSAPPPIKPPEPEAEAEPEGSRPPGKTTASSPAQSGTRGEQSSATDGDDAHPFRVHLAERGRLCSGIGPARPHEFFCPHCGMHNAGLWIEEEGEMLAPCRCNSADPVTAQYQPHPDDPWMWVMAPGGPYLSLIGALDQVYNWMQVNADTCTPLGPLTEPWASVQRILWETTGYREYRPSLWALPNIQQREDPIYHETFQRLDHHKLAMKKANAANRERIENEQNEA